MFRNWLRKKLPATSQKKVSASSRRSRWLRPTLEKLEDRTVPSATWYVNGSASGLQDGSSAHPFATIGQGVTVAAAGDTVDVAAGTYYEHVDITTAITLQGANANVNPNTATRGAETIIDGGLTNAPLAIDASSVTINGFTIQEGENGRNAGIAMSASTSGVDILDNIITDNTIGIYANSNGPSTIQDNLFNANNLPGPAGGTSIYSENTNGLVIDSNVFTGQTMNNPVIFGATAAGVHQNLQFTNNFLDNSVGASAVYCVGITGGVFSGNNITTEGQATGIRLGGADSDISIYGNNIYNSYRGVGVLDDGYGLGDNSNVAIHSNSFTSIVGAGAVDVDSTYDGGSGMVDASGNWWGTAIGANPSDLTAPTAIDALTSGPVTVGSFLSSGTNAAIGNGFVPAASTEMWVPETAGTSGLTRVDGNIQSGIDTAFSGETVRVAADTYVEDLVIPTSLELAGAGQGSTFVLPAVANVGDVNNEGSQIGSATNLIVVQADDVTIDNLTLDGNNPALAGSAGSAVVNGSNVDARNGIITDFTSGTYQNLTVYDDTVQNIFERGIYSTGENYGNTFDFHDNMVSNVAGNGGAIAIFNFGGSGTIEHNTVTEANDAISANWSQGTQFLDNTITDSGSGLHTDNNGGAGGVADLIQGNNVSLGAPGAYGIFVFVPYVNVVVNDNTVAGVDVGLAAFGGAGGSATFTNNGVSTVSGGDGAIVTDDQLGYDTGSVSAAFTGNTLTGGAVGLYAEQILDSNTPASTTTVTATDNAITANSSAGVQMIGGVVTLGGNTIQDNGIGVQVDGGSLTSATQNLISNNTGDGVQVGSQTSTGIFGESYAESVTTTGAVGTLVDNDLSGDGGLGVNNTTAGSVDASGNWWGTAIGANPSDSTAPTAIDGRVSGTVTIGSFLNSGNNISGGNGFVPAASTEMWVPETSATSGLTHVDGSIQTGIDTAFSGETVRVAADTYVGELDIDQPLTLRGAQAGVDPNTSPPLLSAQTIIEPDTADANPYDNNAVLLVYVAADNVTIDGFTVNGSNPNLAANANTVTDGSVTIDTSEGIVSYDGRSNITVENNIVENTAYTGIDFYNYYNGSSATSGNVITQNLVENLSDAYGFGVGILVYDNFYAQITDNVMQNVTVGVQTGNYSQANPGAAASISNNQIAASAVGIFYNLMYDASSTFTVADNNITAVYSAADAPWQGVLLTSIQSAVNVDFQDNTINGSAAYQSLSQPSSGYDVWNTPSTGSLLLSGGTVTGVDYGVWVNTYEGNASDAGNTQVTVSGVNITAASIGVYVEDSPQNGVNTASATIEGNTEISTNTSTGVGILVSGATASATVENNLSTISGNLIGIDVNGGSATVTSNTITDNGTGIRVTSGGNLTSATYNAITDNTTDGILVTASAGTIGTVMCNDFSGNGSYGVENQNSTGVDAEQNYWGSSTGPISTQNPGGLGDAVSSNVAFSPFATNTACTTFAISGATLNLASNSVTVGGTAFLSGTYTDDNGLTSVTIYWGDGSHTNLTPTGSGFGPIAHQYTVPGSLTISVVVENGSGDLGTSSVAIAVSGAPTAGISGPGDGVLYQSRTFTFTASGSIADDSAGYTYVINWGDGTAHSPDLQTVPAADGNTMVVISHSYTSTGNFAVSVTATDQFNQTSTPANQAILVSTAAVEADSGGEGGITGLAISGIGSAGGIVLTPGATPGTITVKRGASTLGTFTPTGGTIAIYGDGGVDTVQVNGVTNSMNTFTLSGNTATFTAVSLSPNLFTIALNGITSITFKGGNSGNSFTNTATTVASTLVGGTGTDTYSFAGNSMGAATTITGAGSSNTIHAPNQNNVWTISASNAGKLNGSSCTFTGVQNLVGGNEDDDFVFTASGTLAGKIDGGSATGNTLDYSAYAHSVTMNLATGRTTGVIMTFANIQSATGDSAVSNTLVGLSSASNWNITGPNSGTVGSFDFANFSNLTGGTGMDTFTVGNSGSVSGTITGGGGNDLLIGPNLPSTFDITTGNGGNIAGVVSSFTGIANLTGGSQANRFVFSAGKSITGNLNGGLGGGTLDYSAYTTSTSVNLQTNKATGVNGMATNLAGLVGGPGTSTVTGANTTNTWNITGTNAGNINGTFTFSSTGNINLTGGTGNDDFVFSNGAGVGGTINGGTGTNALDYSAYTTGVYVNLATGTGAAGAGTLSNIQQIHGSGHNDVLVGNGTCSLVETAGNNLLIGGSGVATIDSGSGYDIVIAGTTSYDTGSSAKTELQDIEGYWATNATSNFSVAVATLSTTGVSGYKLTASTVKHSASTHDTIVLGSGNDWVFYRVTGNYADMLTGAPRQPTPI